jgi:hypothetical protein
MRTGPTLSSWLALPLIGLAVACGEVASIDSASASGECGPGGCFNNDAASDGGVSDVSTDIGNDGPSESGTKVNPLCGLLQCDPDDLEATKCNSGGGMDASAPDADSDVAVEAAHSGMGASFGPQDEPQGGGDPPDDQLPQSPSGSPPLACQVTVNGLGERVAMCVPGGSGTDGSPCVTSSDCAAGFACVGDANTGVCRTYCCLDGEACATGTYCGVKASRDGLVEDPEGEFLLPVCIPANPDCKLLADVGGDNSCDPGLMCAIVRADGTTACVTPGTSVEGEPCEDTEPGVSPCAEGFVCSKATNICLALCRISDADSCDGAVCQGGTSGMPPEYGVCVGSRE